MNNPLFKFLPVITKILNSAGDLTKVDAPRGFPYPLAYPGQVLAVKEIREYDDVLLSSPTGSGKTAVYLSADYPDKSMLIIAPRKYLQLQTAGYRHDCVIFGRTEYPCQFEDNAADAPCRGKKETYSIGDRAVKMFTVFNEKTGKEDRIPYPCPGCAYLDAVSNAVGTIRSGGTVVANFGNYFPYLDHADVIVLDEADLFFASVSSGHKLRHVGQTRPTVKETLEAELITAKHAHEVLMNTTPERREEGRVMSRRIDKSKNHLYAIKSLLESHDLCFQYTQHDPRTGKLNVYVEIRPDKLNALKERLFPRKNKDGKTRKIIIATATPGNFTAEKVITYSLFMRTAVFYAPVALMTATWTSKHPEAFSQCADFIHDTHEGFKKLLGDEGKKTIVHCGSLANAMRMGDLLGKGNCDIHTSGKLMEIVENFRTTPAEYLLVTAAEYGASIDYASHQFMLKVPFAALDEKMQAFQEQIGEKAFSEWYSQDAMSRLVQGCGRIGRGVGGIGFSFILDRKFAEMYGKFHKKLPQSFLDAVKRGETI
jgi:hypothetical protein